MNRKHPLNRKIIGSNISEARDELNKLLLKVDAGELQEAELQVGLLHAYHHLNFAWNTRRIATSRQASFSQREFETWGRYPAVIETFGERSGCCTNDPVRRADYFIQVFPVILETRDHKQGTTGFQNPQE